MHTVQTNANCSKCVLYQAAAAMRESLMGEKCRAGISRDVPARVGRDRAISPLADDTMGRLVPGARSARLLRYNTCLSLCKVGEMLMGGEDEVARLCSLRIQGASFGRKFHAVSTRKNVNRKIKFQVAKSFSHCSCFESWD